MKTWVVLVVHSIRECPRLFCVTYMDLIVLRIFLSALAKGLRDSTVTQGLSQETWVNATRDALNTLYKCKH